MNWPLYGKCPSVDLFATSMLFLVCSLFYTSGLKKCPIMSLPVTQKVAIATV